MFGTREGGNSYKTQAVVFFCRFAKQLVSIATVTQCFSVCWGGALSDETKTAARETGGRIH